MEGLVFSPILPGHPPYPPLFHAATLPFVGMAEATGIGAEDLAPLANLLFIGVLIVSSYLLASTWWGRDRGLVAAALVSLSPPVLTFSREVLVDLALTAWVMAAWTCWVLSRRFSHRGWSVAFGMAAAAGFLTKWTFPMYVLQVAFDTAWTFLRKKGGPRRNSVLAVSLFSVLIAPWMLFNLASLLPRLVRSAGHGAMEGDPAVFSLASLAWYPLRMEAELLLPFLLMGLAGLIWCWRVSRVPFTVLATWLLVGLAFWTLVLNKNFRYVLPLVPVLSLAAASFPVRAGRLLAGAAVLFSVWFSFGPAAAPYTRPPQAENWPLEQILAGTMDLRDSGSDPFTVITLIGNHRGLNGNNLRWYSEAMGLDHRLAFRRRVKRLGELSEFVLMKTGDLGPAHTTAWQVKAREEIQRPGGWFERAFRVARRWKLPDGTETILFQRDLARSAEQALSPEEFIHDVADEVTFENLRIETDEADDLGLDTCRIMADSIAIRGLTFEDVQIVLRGYRAVSDDAGRPRLLRIGSLEIISARITAGAMAAFLTDSSPSVTGAKVTFVEPGGLEIEANLDGKQVHLTASVSEKRDPSAEGGETAASGNLAVHLDRLTIGGFPLPLFMVGDLRGKEIGLRPSRGRPFQLELPSWRFVPGSGESGAIQVGEPTPALMDGPEGSARRPGPPLPRVSAVGKGVLVC